MKIVFFISVVVYFGSFLWIAFGGVPHDTPLHRWLTVAIAGSAVVLIVLGWIHDKRCRK